VTSYFSVGFLHPDEQYYTLDFAFHTLGILEILDTWELNTKIRPWTLPYFISAILYPFTLIGIKNPFTLALIARVFSGVLGFYTLIQFTNSLKRFFNEERFELFKSLSLLFWPFIFMSVRTSSDNWATCFFILGAVKILEREKIEVKSLLFGGLMMGLSFSLRHQTGFLSLPFGLWLLFTKRVSIQSWFLHLSSMILLGVLVGLGLDSIGYGHFTLTPVNYLKENLIKDKISTFGVMPWWGYFTLSFKSLTIFALPLILGTTFYCKKYLNSWAAWVFFPFFIFHSLIGHKELRFIYPVLFLTFYMTFKAFEGKHFKKFYRIFFCLNIIGVIIVMFKPAYTPMKFYDFLYHYKQDTPIKVYIFKDRKGNYPRLEMEVYKRKDLPVVKADMILEQSFYTFTTKYSDLEMINSKYSCKQEYLSYPKWVLQFNPFKWRDRSNIWAFSKCELINK
jgi:phosphatidylinositol glycan class B